MIAGTQSHGQARSLTSLWEPLGAALKQLDALGQDVIVDAGRLGLAGAPEPLLYGADLCLLVTRTDLVALSAARSWADTLRGGFEQQGAGSAVALLTVGEGRPYRAREVAKVLALPVLASVAWDERSSGGVLPRRAQPARVRPWPAAAVTAQSPVTRPGPASAGPDARVTGARAAADGRQGRRLAPAGRADGMSTDELAHRRAPRTRATCRCSHRCPCHDPGGSGARSR